MDCKKNTVKNAHIPCVFDKPNEQKNKIARVLLIWRENDGMNQTFALNNKLYKNYDYKKTRLIPLFAAFLFTSYTHAAQTIHVSPKGKDAWPGTAKKPVASFARAQQLARLCRRDEDVTVLFDDGTYYLPQTIIFTEADSKDLSATVTFRARNVGKAIVSGGKELHLKWERQPDGIYSAAVFPDGPIDQLYINGIRQRMDNSLHPHMWYANSDDVFSHNIVFGAYRQIGMQSAMAADAKWGKSMDRNLFVARCQMQGLLSTTPL